MNTLTKKISVTALSLLIIGCSKQQKSDSATMETSIDSTVSVPIVKDSISSAASTQVRSKDFIKTASVNMEVKDVYDATIKIEAKLKDLGGYVTESNILNDVVSEHIYNQNNDKSVIVKKSQMSNNMVVKVPSMQLAEFLTTVNDQKLFLNSRIIQAKDVTGEIKLTNLEQKRMQNKSQSLNALKQNNKTISQYDDNEKAKNNNITNAYNLKANVEYSTVDIILVEPSIRISEITVTNSKYPDIKYDMNFFYDAKVALYNGFYLIQKVFVVLLNLWPFLIIAGISIYFYRRYSTKKVVK